MLPSLLYAALLSFATASPHCRRALTTTSSALSVSTVTTQSSSFAASVSAATASASTVSTSTAQNSSSTSTVSASSSTCTPCAGNGALTRSQWCDYSIDTDYYDEVPCTGNTREYWFELLEVEGAPDGYTRMLQTINGTVPGPTIFADWGDEIVVHMINSLPAESGNGSSLHFHGIRHNYTNQMDGVVSVTQCPTAPGETYTYKFRATQYGTSWYHSHFGLQAWEGLFGGIVINGPASANYDVDLGNLFIMDWDHDTADELYINAQTQGAISALTGLINGTNVYGDDGDAAQTGQRFETTFEAGTSYLLRLVNVAIDTHFKFTIDNHTMTVIASDFVPVTPYTTTEVSIGMGQRYDIIVTADQAAVASDFWMRAIPQISCSDNDNADNIRGIIHYGDSTSTPTTSSYAIVDECVDESKLVPVVAKTVGSSTVDVAEAAFVGRNAANYLTWTLNGTSYLVGWEDPTLLDVYNNATSQFTNTTNKIELPNAGEWVYLLITEAFLPVTHPIHLHGHDFFVVGSGTTTYDASTAVLNLENPPRRDVALLPAAGWLMLAFQTDNPGAWIMHCHIGWHTLEGFALQFLEMESEIHSLGLIDGTDLTDTCSAWVSYAEETDTVQGEGGLNDSGL